MRIGVIPQLNPEGGGVFQYSLSLIDAISSPGRQSGGEEYGLLTGGYAPSRELLASLPACWFHSPLFPPLPLGARVMSAIVGEKKTAQLSAWLRKKRDIYQYAAQEDGPRPPRENFVPPPPRLRPKVRAWHEKLGLKWNFFLFPSELSFEIGLPFVMPVHDLQHRLQPQFLETSAGGEYEYREYLFQHAARGALLLLSDSETGKEDILNCYGHLGITPERIKPLPFFPAAYVRERPSAEQRAQTRAAFNLPERYFFYPAQFWPHKNHARIVEAIARLRDDSNLKANVVFCGAHSTPIREKTYRDVMQKANELGVVPQIKCLQYVSNEHMAALYAEARALLMPTFFGPTNIPPLEAWSLSCPVITSDIRGIREQMGDAALLVDPNSSESIADAMGRIWADDALCEQLIARGHARQNSYTARDFMERVCDVIQTANQLCS